MCGRYTGNDEDNEEMAEIYRRTEEHYPSSAAKLKHGEICPTDIVPILFGNEMLSVPARWGYPGYRGSGVIINARAESADEKSLFRDSLLYRRCIIPTTGYLEWDRNRTKYRFNRAGDNMLYLGGFCQRFADGARFVILTTEPNDSVRGIHNRMPVIISPDEDSMMRWNTDSSWALEYIHSVMPELVYSAV